MTPARSFILIFLILLMTTVLRIPELYAADSLTVTDVSYPIKIAPNSSFTVSATVAYSFSVSTRIEVDIYDYATKHYISSASAIDYVQGAGQKSYTLTLQSPDREGTWALSAAAFYGSNNEHDATDWFRDFTVAVVTPYWQTTTMAVVTTSTVTSVTTSTYPVTDERSVAVSAIVSFIVGSLIAFAISRRKMRRYREGTRIY